MVLFDQPDPKCRCQLCMVGGGGGSKSVIACGAIAVAAKALGITLAEYRIFIGISGGSVVPAMLACGRDPSEALHQVIEVPFESKIRPVPSIARWLNSVIRPLRSIGKLRILWHYIMRECYWNRRVTSGVFEASELGRYMKSFSNVDWPEKFVSVAVSGNEALVFRKAGVWELQPDGSYEKVAHEPPPFWIVIEATCAVPGMIEAKEVDLARIGKDGIVINKPELLLDGALTRYGRTPIQIVKNMLGGEPGSIIACDVGEDPPDNRFLFRVVRKLFCGDCCKPQPEPEVDSEGVILIQPRFDKIKALEFSYTLDQKWEAVIQTIIESEAQFRLSGRYRAEQLSKLQAVCADFKELQSKPLREGELAHFAAQILINHGLYY